MVYQNNKSSTQNTENCTVCDSILEYLNETKELICLYCGKVEHEHICCPNGHYICDMCHNKATIEIIADISLTTKSANPFEISGLMMSYPGLLMLGCQHS